MDIRSPANCAHCRGVHPKSSLAATHANPAIGSKPPSCAVLWRQAEALEHGSALGILQPYPISLESLRTWAGTLADKGLALAPVSALLIEGAGLAAQLRGHGAAAGAESQG